MHSRHPARHAIPKLWLMTDERMGSGMIEAVRRLPKGQAGVVLRNYSLPDEQRRALFDNIRAIARRRRLMLLLAGLPHVARGWKAQGWHGRGGKAIAGLVHSMAVHNRSELTAAIRARADLVFISPVFPTRSHPGARALGPLGIARLARVAPMPVIALGGMDLQRMRRLNGLNVHGYAAIDAWLAPASKP